MQYVIVSVSLVGKYREVTYNLNLFFLMVTPCGSWSRVLFFFGVFGLMMIAVQCMLCSLLRCPSVSLARSPQLLFSCSPGLVDREVPVTVLELFQLLDELVDSVIACQRARAFSGPS